MMKIVIWVVVFLLPFSLNAQLIQNRDAIIRESVNEVSVNNLRATIQNLVGFHNRNNLSSTTDKAQGIGAAAEYLYQKILSYAPESEGRLKAEKVHYIVRGKGTRLGRDVRLCNIVATIQGSDPKDDRIIAVLAHYDSRAMDILDSVSYAPGANDNGSGVACLMEMTRLLSKINFPITIKLMFLSGEEHGLYGAQFMSDLAKRENWNLIAVINNDMIGNSDASETGMYDNTVMKVFSENIPMMETEEMRKIRVFNSAENDSYSRQLARYVKEIGERYVDNLLVKLVYRLDRFGRGGDHAPFCRNGYTTVRICESNENYNRTHQNVREENGIKYGDEIEAIDFNYLKKNTSVNIAVVANLALAPSVPENVKLHISGLSNFTEITWDAPVNGKTPDAYYVLLRETDKSNWEKKILVNDTKVKLPYNKDSYFFAVQSVDEQGHESLAIFAEGRR